MSDMEAAKLLYQQWAELSRSILNVEMASEEADEIIAGLIDRKEEIRHRISSLLITPDSEVLDCIKQCIALDQQVSVMLEEERDAAEATINKIKRRSMTKVSYQPEYTHTMGYFFDTQQ